MTEGSPEVHDDQETELEPFTTRVPGDLKQAVRLQAVAQRKTLQDVTTEALQEWLDKHKQ